MGYQSAIQLLLIIISVVIIFTYIKPTFDDMKATEAESTEYDNALENASSFNQELQRLMAVIEAIDDHELALLRRYLPNEIDTVAVMRDIETIVRQRNMGLVSLESGSINTRIQNQENVSRGQGEPVRTNQNGAFTVKEQQFNAQIFGTYGQFKLLLQDLERNIYPLEVVQIEFSPGEGSLYTFSVALETYFLSSNNATE